MVLLVFTKILLLCRESGFSLLSLCPFDTEIAASQWNLLQTAARGLLWERAMTGCLHSAAFRWLVSRQLFAWRSMQSELYITMPDKTFSLFSLDRHRMQDFCLLCGGFPLWAARLWIVCYCVLASSIVLHRSVTFSLSQFPTCSPSLCHSLLHLCGIKPSLHH